MSLDRLISLRLVTPIVLAGFLCLSGFAQDSPQTPQPAASAPSAPQPHSFVLQNYSKPRSPFPNFIAPYTSRTIPPPNLTNTPRIDQLMHDGRLMLSMDDAVALALENNLDIAIARYNLNIADTDILRTKAGANLLGVNSGIVQNTPGGGVGGLGGTVGSGPGGTAPASGGIGAGTSGLVNSTLGIGSPITSFDPIITGTFGMDRNHTLSTSAFNGVPVLSQSTGTANVAYVQGFPTGTIMSLGFNNTHVTTNQPFSTLSPILNTNFQFKLTQHLLQGFGFLPNTRFIRLAKNNREISDVAFRLQIITTVDQIENMYWNLVYAYENVKVQKEALAFAQKTMSDTQKQVQIGSMAPIQVVGAQSTVATDQQALILAQTNLEQQQLLMKNALSRTLVDPALADAEVIPTSDLALPDQEAVIPTQDLINDALNHRAELAESRIDLTNRDINNKAVRNALRPTLDLFAYYGGSGLGGNLNPNAQLCSPTNQTAFCVNPANLPPQFTSSRSVGYGTALDNLVTSAAPDKGVGLTLNIPIRNRLAQADQVRAELEFRQAQMRLQQIENQIRIEVRVAQFSLQQNRASVEAAKASQEFARQTLDAEQKKLALGASTSTLVLQDQSALTTSESNLVSAMAAYEKSRVEMDRATGLLLEHSGIVIDDAERGEVTHMPQIPDIAPRKDVESVMPVSTTPPEQAPPQQ
ncbi:MAG: TolC family protein [Terriglobales bacterium]